MARQEGICACNHAAPAAQGAAAASPNATAVRITAAAEQAEAGCGAAPEALNSSVPNVLLIGDSISMGYGYARGDTPHCACGAGDCLAVRGPTCGLTHNNNVFVKKNVIKGRVLWWCHVHG